MSECRYCAGECGGADLAPLLTQDLAWLWTAVAAAADRRGDITMSEGQLTITAPAEPNARAAAVGLLGGRALRAGQRREVDLAALTTRLGTRGDSLTPGAVAAHAVRHRLGVKVAAKRARQALLDAIRYDLERRLKELPEHIQHRVDTADSWSRLRTAGWLARISAHPDPHQLIVQASAVLAALPKPGERSDRRTLVPNHPHALDDGTTLAGLVLALTRLAGIKTRAAWDALGVDCDDLMGGLLALGIHPAGWSLPQYAVVTIPPRELGRCVWPAPRVPGSWVFVTENPSVVAAASGIASNNPSTPVRLLCTVGTPSALEVAAIAALSEFGWRVAVRADFDGAGLGHMRALLDACPDAEPWRMRAADYLASQPTGTNSEPIVVAEVDTPWDPALARAMTRTGAPGFEEALLPSLLQDLAIGLPGQIDSKNVVQRAGSPYVKTSHAK